MANEFNYDDIINNLTKELTGRDVSQGGGKRVFVKKIDKTPQVLKNIATTGKGIKTGAQVAGKTAGKAMPFLGAGLSVGDAYRSGQIAYEMEQANKLKPGSFPQEAIDYYKGKAKAIGAATGVGAVGGGVLGSGVFSVPGAAIGAGTGGMLGDVGYRFANRNNPYYEYPYDPSILQGLQNAQRGTLPQQQQDEQRETGLSNGYDFEILNDEDLTNNPNAIGDLIRGNGLPPQLPRTSTALNNGSQRKVNMQPQVEQQVASDNQAKILSDYINRYNANNLPYVEALENFYNNYDANVKNARNWDRYYTGLAGWTGNNRWADIAKSYNPVKIEADKLNILQQLQKAKLGNINDVYELIGNMEVAKQMGLPVEAAMANKNILTALVNQQKANLANEARIYGYDTTADTRRYVADQALRSNLYGRDISGRYGVEGQLLGSLAYSDPETAIQILRERGLLKDNGPARGLSKEGLAQNPRPQTNYFKGIRE